MRASHEQWIPPEQKEDIILFRYLPPDQQGRYKFRFPVAIFAYAPLVKIAPAYTTIPPYFMVSILRALEVKGHQHR